MTVSHLTLTEAVVGIVCMVVVAAVACLSIVRDMWVRKK